MNWQDEAEDEVVEIDSFIETLSAPDPDEWTVGVDSYGVPESVVFSVSGLGGEGKSWRRYGGTTAPYDYLSSSIQLVDLGTTFVPTAAVGYSGCKEVELEIARARAVVLGLQDNWDGEGSPPYKKETFERAAEFTRELTAQVVSESAGSVLVPVIGPAMGGSVDLYWKSTAVTLLVNIPEDRTVLATYSGRRENGESTTGRVSERRETFRHLAVWLADAR